MTYRITLGPCDHEPLCGPEIIDLVSRSSVSHPILCGVCAEDTAYVLVSEESIAQAEGRDWWYGHCAVCGHSVFLGKYGTHWLGGEPLAVTPAWAEGTHP